MSEDAKWFAAAEFTPNHIMLYLEDLLFSLLFHTCYNLTRILTQIVFRKISFLGREWATIKLAESTRLLPYIHENLICARMSLC